jgi:hypothetical protein
MRWRAEEIATSVVGTGGLLALAATLMLETGRESFETIVFRRVSVGGTTLFSLLFAWLMLSIRRVKRQERRRAGFRPSILFWIGVNLLLSVCLLLAGGVYRAGEGHPPLGQMAWIYSCVTWLATLMISASAGWALRDPRRPWHFVLNLSPLLVAALVLALTGAAVL